MCMCMHVCLCVCERVPASQVTNITHTCQFDISLLQPVGIFHFSTKCFVNMSVLSSII